jgi:hypothetical protein
MPNWCSNYVMITGPAAEVDALEKYLAQEPLPDDYHGLCEYFVPQPQGLTGDWDWYNWRVENWGTKWEVDVNTTRSGKTLALAFDSAWAPPVPVFEAMHARGFAVRAAYWEPGMAFAGEWNSELGDLYLEYKSIEELVRELPWVDTVLGVSETAVDWDDD